MRVFNGASYLVSGGLFLYILSTGTGGGAMPWYAWLLGLGAIVYGLYVLFTKGSYWVSSATYLGPLALIIWAFVAR
jgi:hypothetical protein